MSVDITSGEFETQLHEAIRTSFHSLPQDIRDRHADFIIEYLRVEEAHVVEAEDLGRCLKIAGQINAPNGDLTRKIIIILHWPPIDEEPEEPEPETEPLPEPARTGSRKRPAPATAGDAYPRRKQRGRYKLKARLDHPQKPFATTLDKGNHTIDVLLRCFPDLDLDALLFDIYTRRRDILDENGERLEGTDPYSFNKGLPLHHANAVSLIEDSDADVVLLCGIHVRAFFEENFGPLTNAKKGCLMTIGKKDRQIFYMDHPEYSGHYASRDRLVQTLDTLRRVSKACGAKLDETWLTKAIATRGVPPTPPQERVKKIPKAKVNKAKSRLQLRIERRQALYATLSAGERGRREKCSASQTRFYASEAGMKEREFRSKTKLGKAIVVADDGTPKLIASLQSKTLDELCPQLKKSLYWLGYDCMNYGLGPYYPYASKGTWTREMTNDLRQLWLDTLDEGPFPSDDDFKRVVSAHDHLNVKQAKKWFKEWRADYRKGEYLVDRFQKAGELPNDIVVHWHSRNWKAG
ncbi:hypothetical protein HII31_06698 [Pseudocercospora fuligena]|uniref:Uncharacterized protein n=1 Tax=Pseudocercospora fuligena TaxID=685502 RepID=A0A8H6RJK9_9PEZI|nr:hypothetical protein HII31_06698 [Pseudocercospora fuligena]